MGRGVTGPERQIHVVEFVAAVSIHIQFIRALGHDENASALVVRVFQGTKSLQERVARSRKLWVCKHTTKSGKGTHVEVTSDEVDVVLQIVRIEAAEQVSGGITFLGHNIVDVDRAERDCGRAGKGRAPQKSSDHKDYHAPRLHACRGFVKGKDCRVRPERVPFEQEGEVRITCVRDELVRDMWHVITGFLWDDRMKPSSSRCDDIGGVPARGPGFH